MEVNINAMLPLYTSEQCEKLDKAITDTGLASGASLMEQAALACFNEIIRRWPKIKKIAIFAGPGNNGGDGYLLGRKLLSHSNYEVELIPCLTSKARGKDATNARQKFLAGGGVEAPVSRLAEENLAADLIVDAIFGTGLKRFLSDDILAAVKRINNARHKVLAVDMPSGLNSDTGIAMPAAVRANATVTFITRKPGMYTAEGRDYCGDIVFAPLGNWENIVAKEPPAAQLLCYEDICKHLPRRRRDSHKNEFGHVLVIGGNYGMAGAIRLCGEAALRAGAGLVSVATRAENVTTIVSGCPPLMTCGVKNAKDLAPLTQKADVIACGPGLGNDAWAKALMAQVMEAKQPLVLDADALNLLALEPRSSRRWLLTPHPGEAGRMLGISGQEVQKNRLLAATKLQRKYGGVVILKGCGSVIFGDGMECPIVSLPGNPGMATAGAGDVLTGALAGLLAQGFSPRIAAQTAVCVHGRAGDIAAQNGERGLIATDIVSALRKCVNPNIN